MIGIASRVHDTSGESAPKVSGEEVADDRKANEKENNHSGILSCFFHGFSSCLFLSFRNPIATRRRVAMGLRKLRNKQLENPWKKHDNIPL